MKHRGFAALLFTWAVLVLPADSPAPRAIQLPDILAWKTIQGAVVSADGQWLAYHLNPAEGNAEVVVRNLKTGQEDKYPAGDRQASTPAPARCV